MLPRKRVIIITPTARDETRRLLRAIAAHERHKTNWRIYLDEDLQSLKDPTWLFDKKWHGVIVNAFDSTIARGCLKRGIPCVDFNDEAPPLPGIPKIRPDNVAIGHQVAEHFRERGHSHFAFCGFSDQSWSTERRDGFLEATKLMGYPCEVFETPYRHVSKELLLDIDPDWDKSEGERIANWLKTLKLPVAIMTPNDQRAIQLTDACQDLGLKVPNDVAIVGTNNNTVRCELRHPSISSIPVNAKAMGSVIAQTLSDLMAGQKNAPPEIRIEPLDVVTRQSSDAFAIDDPLTAKATQTIRKLNGIDLTVDRLADLVHSSRSQLERGFRKHLGHSPQSEIRQAQISYAKQLLANTEISVHEVALLSGFKHPEYMSVVFKKLTGESPGSYRTRVSDTA